METICAPMLEGWEQRQPDGGKGRHAAAAAHRANLTYLPERNSGSAGRRGSPNVEVARRLAFSRVTVSIHFHCILRVLDGKSRTEVAHLARKMGLLDGSSHASEHSERNATTGGPAPKHDAL
jgi:hypothetical protein